MSEEEYEEYEEEEEVEDSNNKGQPQSSADEPQQKNTNMIIQPKAEDKKSINSKKSGASKASKAKNSMNKKSAVESNNTKNKTSSKANKSKNSNVKNEDDNTYKLNGPIQVVSTRAYLEKTVSNVIQEALLELARRRPENPLEFVGNYILKKAKEQ